MIPLPYRILAAIFIVASAFVYGYIKGVAVGDQKIKLFEAKAIAEYQKLQAAYEKAKNAVNERVVTEYVDRIVYVTKWRTKNVEIVKEVPSNCELSNGWVHVHDSAAKGGNADRTSAADGTSSGIKDTEALETVIDNYGTCAINAEKVKAWQKWYNEQYVVVGKINRENGVSDPDNLEHSISSDAKAKPHYDGESSGIIIR